MNHPSHARVLPSLLATVLLAVGSGIIPGARAAEPAASNKARPAAAKATPKPDGLLAALPPMTVHKSPTCGCCMIWVKHLEAAGFNVKTQDSNDMGAVKSRLGVPASKGSCHTAVVGGYFIEGHVPAADIKRLLAEKPDAKGITVPGMPLGSPGMEVPDGTVQPYAVELVGRDGKTRVYSRHGN